MVGGCPLVAKAVPRTAVPFRGQTSQISSSLSPKRDCGSKGVLNGNIITINTNLFDATGIK